MEIRLTINLGDGITGEIVIDGDDADELYRSVKGAVFPSTMSKALGYDVEGVEIIDDD